MPLNPTVLVLLDKDGQVSKVASNIAPVPELNVVVLTDERLFNIDCVGKTFVQDVP